MRWMDVSVEQGSGISASSANPGLGADFRVPIWGSETAQCARFE